MIINVTINPAWIIFVFYSSKTYFKEKIFKCIKGPTKTKCIRRGTVIIQSWVRFTLSALKIEWISRYLYETS